MNRTFFIWQAIVGTWLFLAGFTAAAQQRKADTVMAISFPAQTINVALPIRYIEIPKYETVYVCPPTVQPLHWSSYTGSFQAFVNEAAKLGRVAYIDKDVQPITTIVIPSGLQLTADTNITIRSKAKTLFQLHTATGLQFFSGLRIVQDSGSTAFHRITSGVAFYDSLHNVQVRGGSIGYESSRGGTENKMAITAMRNCYFDNEFINVAVYSQDGPYRALHLYNVQLSTKRSHNIYVHPATSLHYDSVASLARGKLFQHQYSGSGNGGYNTGKYSVFKRVYCNGGAFEMTTLADENPVIITNSNIAPYVTSGVPPALVNAQNSHLFNAGNGIFLRGSVDSCTGGVWGHTNYPLHITNSNLIEYVYRAGGNATIENSSIKYVWGADRGSDFTMTFRNCTIGQLSDGGKGNGTATLLNSFIQQKPNVRPGIMQ